MSNGRISFRQTQRLKPGQNQGPLTLGAQPPAMGRSRQEVAQLLHAGHRGLTEDIMAERQWVERLMNLAEQKIQLEESAKKARLRRNLVIALAIALSPVVGAVVAMVLTTI